MNKNWTCKTCGKEFYTYEIGFFHSVFIHHIKPSKTACLNFFKYGIAWKSIKFILKLPLYILFGITLPFRLLNEILSEIV